MFAAWKNSRLLKHVSTCLSKAAVNFDYYASKWIRESLRDLEVLSLARCDLEPERKKSHS